MRFGVILGVMLAGMLMPSVLLAAPCSFRAHHGPENAEDRCAGQIHALGALLEKHPIIAEACEGLPDLAHLALGGDWTGVAMRQRLGPGRSILAIRCFQAAYNAQWLLFAMDDRGHALPKLLLFRTVPQPDQPDFSDKADLRDLVKGRLYTYQKMLGDGSGGVYAEYQIRANDLHPVLQIAIIKPYADHRGSYHFRRGQRPQGAGWRRVAVPKQPAKQLVGCLIDLADLTEIPTCPPSQP